MDVYGRYAWRTDDNGVHVHKATWNWGHLVEDVLMQS